MGNEGGGIDDFPSSLSVIQIVCTKVDIGTCGSEEMILLGIIDKMFITHECSGQQSEPTHGSEELLRRTIES